MIICWQHFRLTKNHENEDLYKGIEYQQFTF